MGKLRCREPLNNLLSEIRIRWKLSDNVTWETEKNVTFKIHEKPCSEIVPKNVVMYHSGSKYAVFTIKIFTYTPQKFPFTFEISKLYLPRGKFNCSCPMIIFTSQRWLGMRFKHQTPLFVCAVSVYQFVHVNVLFLCFLFLLWFHVPCMHKKQ